MVQSTEYNVQKAGSTKPEPVPPTLDSKPVLCTLYPVLFSAPSIDQPVKKEPCGNQHGDEEKDLAEVSPEAAFLRSLRLVLFVDRHSLPRLA